MLVDAHAHVFDRLHDFGTFSAHHSLDFGRIRTRNGSLVRLLPPLARNIEFRAEMLLEYMDWADVDRAVLLQGPFYGDTNEYVASVVRQWPDRFIGAALVDPLSSGASGQLRRCTEEWGFRALKLELSSTTGYCSMYPDFRLDDSRLDWLWQAVTENDMTVVVDLGDIGTRSYQIESLSVLAGECPDVRWVIAHLGRPSPDVRNNPTSAEAWMNTIRLAKQPNVWLDLAALPSRFLEEDYPYPSVSYFVRRALQCVGAEKLMWGTDAPATLTYMTYVQARDVIVRSLDGLSSAERDLISGGNAIEVYA